MWFFCVEGRTTTEIDPNTGQPVYRTDYGYDPSYFKTLPAILKIIQLVLNLLGFICIEVTIFSYHGRGRFFDFVSMAGFWFTLSFFMAYLFHTVERCHKIPWLKIELGYCCLWVVLYLLAASLVVGFATEAFTVAGVFGYLAMITYAIEAYMKWTLFKSGRPPQGQPVENTPPTAIAPPPYKQ